MSAQHIYNIKTNKLQKWSTNENACVLNDLWEIHYALKMWSQYTIRIFFTTCTFILLEYVRLVSYTLIKKYADEILKYFIMFIPKYNNAEIALSFLS